MKPLTIVPYDADGSEWNEFGARQDGWTHFHAYGWRDVIERTFGHECLYWSARDDAGCLQGILPLVRVKSALFGHFLVSMPFLNYGGPLGTSTAVRQLAERAADEARTSGAKLLQLRSAIPLDLDLHESHRKVTVVLPLDPDPDTVWKGLGSKVRSQIRRPQKEGVEVRSGADQLTAFYDVFSRHMRDLGTPVMPRSFFANALDVFPDSSRLVVAYLEDRPIACALGFRFGDEFEVTWASALQDVKRIAANMLVYWELMRLNAAEGVRRFNFGRCTPGGGTHRFKLQWGGQDEPLYWYERSKREGTTTPSPDAGAYRWGPRIWRLLPLPLASAIGPGIVKYIP